MTQLQRTIKEKKDSIERIHSARLEEYLQVSGWIYENVRVQDLQAFRSHLLDANTLHPTMTRTISDKIEKGMKEVD